MHRILKTLEKPGAVPALVLVLVSLYWMIRVVGFSGLGGDEAEQVLFAQSLAWGYDVANPPLYTWILIALFGLFGKSVGLVLALKMAVLALVYLALHGAARITLGPQRRLDAALVALSPLLIFFVSWNSIFSYSHSLLNALFVIVTYIVVVKVLEDRRWRWYVALGLVIGLGVLTKYSYLMFLVGMVGAAFSLAELRERIRAERLLAAFVLAALICAPHALWLADQADQLLRTVNYKLQIGEETPYVVGLAKGVWNIVRASFAFMSPLWLVLLLMFPAFLKKTSAAQPHPLQAALLGRAFLIVLALMVAIVALGGATQFRPNYLFLLILFPLWVFLRIPGEVVPGKRRRVYGALLLGAALLSVGMLTGKAVVDPLRCKKCQMFIPYQDVARALQARGFTGGTLFAAWHPAPLPGNLALYMDEARVVSKKFRAVRPPHRDQLGQCLVVWVALEQGGPEAAHMLSLTELTFGLGIDRQQPVPIKRLEIPLQGTPGRTVLIDYLLLDSGAGDCR